MSESDLTHPKCLTKGEPGSDSELSFLPDTNYGVYQTVSFPHIEMII